MLIFLQLLETWCSAHMQSPGTAAFTQHIFIQLNLCYCEWGFTLAELRKTFFICRLSRDANWEQKLRFSWNFHQSWSCWRLEIRALACRISKYQQSCFSLRTASLMPTDAIGRLQIGFATVEAGDFPNGLRYNRQIRYIRVCHSAHHQISSFPTHWKTGHD